MRLRSLEIPGYLVAAILILFPVVDSSLSLTPLRFGDVMWRFGAVGMLSRALMTPLLGLFIALCLAVLFERPRVVMSLAVLSAFAALCLAVVVPLFILDIVQMRSNVRDEGTMAYDVVSAVALLKYGIAFIILMFLAVGGWKAGRRGVRQAKPVRAPTPLVGTQGAAGR